MTFRLRVSNRYLFVEIPTPSYIGNAERCRHCHANTQFNCIWTFKQISAWRWTVVIAAVSQHAALAEWGYVVFSLLNLPSQWNKPVFNLREPGISNYKYLFLRSREEKLLNFQSAGILSEKKVLMCDSASYTICWTPLLLLHYIHKIWIKTQLYWLLR